MIIDAKEARRLGAKTVRTFGYRVQVGRYVIRYHSTTAGTDRFPWRVWTGDAEIVDEFESMRAALQYARQNDQAG